MKLRIRNAYKHGRKASVQQQANILAYNIWQIALAGAKNLHQEDYHYDSDEQRVGVITEYLIFLVHIADRLAYDGLSEAEKEAPETNEKRAAFILHLAQDTARQLQRNTEEIMGVGDYKAPYFALINDRMPVYARGLFKNGQAGFSLLRIFADHIYTIMGDSQTNKWTLQQIMDIDGPMMIEKMHTSMLSITGQQAAEDDKKTSVELLLDP